jgi:uncharacterized caspase-like protein
MMSPIARLILLLTLALQCIASPAAGEERRVALVIGNSGYRNAQPLPNTLNDARDMTVALRKVGFEVVDGLDLDKRGMDQVVARFARLARDADAVLFYYAGHGLQFNGENYLVPVEARVEDEVSVQYETTRLNDVITALGFARGVKIMVLDACRNNPFVRQLASKQATRGFAVGNGLAPIARAQGMVVAYATQANDVAADGTGRNSPFTAALVQEIQTPGLEIASMFRRVQKVVYDATGGKQTPELSLSLLGDFYLNREETDADVWRAVRASDDPAVLNGFIARFPNSFFAIDARTKLDLIDRRAAEERDRDRLAREFGERERALLERLRQAERERQRTAESLARRAMEDVATAPAIAPTPAQPARPDRAAAERAEKERLASDLARKDAELASLETERRRLDEERQAQEQAMAARLGSLTLGAPEPPVQLTAPQRQAPVDRRIGETLTATPATRPTPAACASALGRAQLGELSDSIRDLLRQCR